MRYAVSRTSGHDDETPPCEGAFRASYVYIDERTADDPAKIPAARGKSEWWYNEGTNHRVVNGHIMRDLGQRQAWFVELNDLDAFNAFVAKHGSAVVGPLYGNPSITEIEIYDSYRE